MMFRQAKREELPDIIDLFSEAFREDPLMALFNPSEKRKEQFIHQLFAVNTKAYFRKHLCLIALDEGQIVGVALVKKQDVAEINVFDYALAGGWRLIFLLGVRDFFSFLSVFDQAQKDCQDIEGPTWYLDTLAVNKKSQGVGIGSNLLQECLIPYIQQNGGGTLTLITQNQANCAFYKRNGFTNFSQHRLTNGQLTGDNFSFKQTVAPLNK